MLDDLRFKRATFRALHEQGCFVLPNPWDVGGIRRLEKFGFKVGSARVEAYDGVAPDTVLKQFPPAGYPLSNKEVVSLTVSRPPEAPAPRS